MIQFADDKGKKELKEIHLSEEEELMQFLSKKYGLPYIDLIPVPVENDALRLVPEKEAREARIAPFALNNKKIGVAIQTPNAPETKTALDALTKSGYEVAPYLASGRSLEKAWSHYQELSSTVATHAGTVDIGEDTIQAAAQEIRHLPDLIPKIEEAIQSKTQNRVSRLVETILGAAIALGASDIHIEPEETYILLRFRLDGILQDVTRFEAGTYKLINSRIKLISGLKLNIRAEAQDGRFSVHVGESDIEVRTSLLPGAYGESIVLRILDPKSISVPLEELGIHPVFLSRILHEIGKPNGMLLTTGPTGSGKTTTLYAFLKRIHTPGVKIITIEDPVEYHLPGIVQTQVEKEKHYTFASGLRSTLRQDPDVIMVGEIRDEETAEIAVNAALTGHLVFSTLHTNDAAGTFPRLIDLGVNPKIISAAVNLAMAQRLVRKLCSACKKETKIPEHDRARIESALKTLSPSIEVPQREIFWTATGCAECNKTGFKGRTGIYEGILADAALEKIIRENPSEREIQAAAAPQGIPTMLQDGILKVLAGITSLEELERIVDFTN